MSAEKLTPVYDSWQDTKPHNEDQLNKLVKEVRILRNTEDCLRYNAFWKRVVKARRIFLTTTSSVKAARIMGYESITEMGHCNPTWDIFAFFHDNEVDTLASVSVGNLKLDEEGCCPNCVRKFCVGSYYDQ